MSKKSDKITQFERRVNDVLNPKYISLCEQRDVIIEDQANYLRLSQTVSKLKGKKELRTKVDLGCNFFCDAEIDDCSTINVHLGSGIYCELNHSEIADFCKKKFEILEEKSSFLTDQITEVKAEIQIIKEGIRELQQYSLDKTQNRRSVFNF